jgi:hypothetical protein
MEIGKKYVIVFTTGRYEIEYEYGVKCTKKNTVISRRKSGWYCEIDKAGLDYETQVS